MKDSPIFQPAKIGPVQLRNRTIRAAAYESMCPGHVPSEELYNYHRSVAAGGIGMTTISYAAVAESGLSFDRQLWMRPDIVPGLRRLVDAIHAEGAAASIQLGHCGNMSHRAICGCTPVSSSGGFNIYSPTFVHALKEHELMGIAADFGNAVRLACEAGFDAVEIHAGHGYLISQFLTPLINRRRDQYGGSLENRMRFMNMCMDHVLANASSRCAIIVKMNMRDGCRGGMPIEESIEVARQLQNECGADALVLSGGLVSRSPMYVMRGAMPIRCMTHYMDSRWLAAGVRLAGRMMIPSAPFQEAYFLEDAKRFREEIDIPLIYVGGLVSRPKIEEVLGEGFEFVAMARALINEPGFVNRMKEDENARCDCGHSNYCIARMYSREMACHKHMADLPAALQREIRRLENR